MWKQNEGAIEGLMYDFEGKVVYATERNLEVLDNSLKRSVKEFRAIQRLRKSTKI